jgi:hypothetical protein
MRVLEVLLLFLTKKAFWFSSFMGFSRENCFRLENFRGSKYVLCEEPFGIF